MEALGGFGTATVPIYKRDRSVAAKSQTKARDKSSKKRSKSKKRAPPPPPVNKAASSSSGNTGTPRASTSDGWQEDHGFAADTRGRPRNLRNEPVRDRKPELREVYFPSATGSTVSLPPAPPTPPLTPHTPGRLRRQDHAGSPWDEARRGRSSSTHGYRGKKEETFVQQARVPQNYHQNRVLSSSSSSQFTESEKGLNQGFGQTAGASVSSFLTHPHHSQKSLPTDRSSSSIDFDPHHRQHPPRQESLLPSSPALTTASGPDPPLADRHERQNLPRHPIADRSSRSPPPSRPHLLRSASTQFQPPQRPSLVTSQSAYHVSPQSPPLFLRPGDVPFPKPRAMAPSNSGTTYSSASNVGTATFNPASTFQHIQDMSAKRVSTLDYLRKTHEGRVYWFNTLLYSRPDILRLPSFQPARLGRRASHLLMLGLSLPVALDGAAGSAMEYLRALNALLSEFEQYQTIHPVEGGTNTSGSFGRTKIPQMFKRNQGVKTRRASTAADIGLPMATSDPSGLEGGVDPMTSSTGSLGGGGGGVSTPGSIGGGHMNASSSYTSMPSALPAPSGAASAMSLPTPDANTLLPGEEYTLLLTPSLPFEPDFFEVFATLCDVLIDVYVRISSLINTPEKVAVQPGLGEIFAKADARVRKVLVQGVVKEFEDATRGGVKNEVTNVGKVVVGGVM